jgi:Transcriptional regulator
MLDLRRLRILRELQVRGTLAAVAEALSFSPSSVSQQLSVLEREVGVPLTERAGRRLRLTPQGVLLAERAGEALAVLEAAESDLAESGTAVRGTVRIAVFQSAAHAVLPRALTILRSEHPLLRAEVSELSPETGLFGVVARDVDLAIAEQYPGHRRAGHAELDRVPLAKDDIRLGTGPVARRGIRRLSDAADATWVMEPNGTASRQWATQLCRAAGFDPDVRFETADLTAHIRLIASDNAVGLIPDLMWAGERPSVRLVDLPGSPHRDLFTSTRVSARSRPAIRAVRDALARAVAGDQA